MAMQCRTESNSKEPTIWASLVHLSFNMWFDWDPPEYQDHESLRHSGFKPYLRFDEELWNDIIRKMSQVGMNMLVLDLGDGIRYRSHPEIAVENAWSVERLRDELAILRDLGLEPVPKLNFSTWHDAWLGRYHKLVSSDAYYAVCRDLIAEVCEIFDKPRFFHLGMDEEYTTGLGEMEKRYKHQFTRRPNMYWHDLYFLLGQVEKAGARPWAFFDERNPGGAEGIYRKLPKSVVLTAWNYGRESRFDRNEYKIKAFHEMSDLGFDQIPCGSNISVTENFSELVDYCFEHVDPDHLLGFMMAPWQPTLESCRRQHIEAIELVGATIDKLSV